MGLKASPAVEVAQRNHERAFAMLVRVYEEVRRGLAYLRWYEDDVDAIAPSLYTRKKRRGGGAMAVEPVTEPAVEQDGGAAAVNPTPETTDGAAE